MIPFIDLKTQQKRIRSKVEKSIKNVLDHGQYILGPEVKELEKKLADIAKVNHVLCCSSGTDALLLALIGLKLKPGEGVIVPAFTFASTAEVMPLLGAIPIFSDVDPNTYNIDCNKLGDALDAATKKGIKVRGVMPVGLFGQPSDMNEVLNFAVQRGLWVLDDAAQSFGAMYDGKPVGGLCEVTATSFFPAKPLGCYGDGGALFTSNNEIYEIANSCHVHGMGKKKYEYERIGMNARISTIQAAILLEKLAIFPSELIERQKVADLYHFHLNDLNTDVQLPVLHSKTTSSWAQYTIVLPEEINRDKLQKNLAAKDIPTAVYYPIPLNRHKPYKDYPVANNGLGVTNALSKSVLSLPMHPYLSEDNIIHISKNINELIKNN